MAQPPPYNRAFNFANYQSTSPSDPLPAQHIEAELNRIKATLDVTLNNLALIQRDDTALANASVGNDQLKAEFIVNFNPATHWSPGVAYVVNDTVFESQKLYRALVSHVSGVFATDLAAGRWLELEDFTLTAADASTTTKGIIEIATDSEARNMVATDKAIVPSNLAAMVGAEIQAWDAGLDDVVAAEVEVESASTCDILGAASQRVRITGTTTITSFGTGGDRVRFVRFTDSLTLVHTEGLLVLPGGANIITANGDAAIVVSSAPDVARVISYQRAAASVAARRLLSVTRITSSQTYNTPVGVTLLRVRGVAGGGAGGRGQGATSQGTAGAGGGAGQYGEVEITNPNATYSVTIGAGAPTSTGSGGGGDGGNSVFGAAMTLVGGSGGAAMNNSSDGSIAFALDGGAGGAGGSGGNRIPGQRGGGAWRVGNLGNDLPHVREGGAGGNSILGLGGSPCSPGASIGTSSDGRPGTGYGSGGGGGRGGSATGNGGAGADGVFYVEAWA